MRILSSAPWMPFTLCFDGSVDLEFSRHTPKTFHKPFPPRLSNRPQMSIGVRLLLGALAVTGCEDSTHPRSASFWSDLDDGSSVPMKMTIGASHSQKRKSEFFIFTLSCLKLLKERRIPSLDLVLLLISSITRKSIPCGSRSVRGQVCELGAFSTPNQASFVFL